MFTYKNKLAAFSLGLVALYSFNAWAQPVNHHIVVAPQCLTQNLSTPHKTLASANSLSLIDITNDGIDQLIKAKENNKTLCGGFMDVSQAWDEFNSKNNIAVNSATIFLHKYAQAGKKSLTAGKLNYEIKYPVQVNQLLKQINPQLMWNNLGTLSSMKDRYANSDNGVAAANWFKQQIENIARENNRSDVTVTLIETGTRYKQPSVVAKVGSSSGPGIVIGAHMDTLNSTFSNKPGADDDGSGSVTVLEAARTLLSSGMEFKKPIYFIWYAAEEEGLVGSGYVVSQFRKQNIPVDAVLHFDLTGYAYNNESTMWLMDDYVNPDLVNYVEKLIQNYVKRPIQHDKCGYACSDHASWTQEGYAAALPAEAAYKYTNPTIHSQQDTTDKLSLVHMTDYLKLATAFAVEMAEPKA